MAAVDEALLRLYPTRRWGEPDDARSFGAGVSAREGRALAATLARELKAATFYQPGAEDEYCDYVYVLCVGREPCLVRIREGAHLPELDGEPVREIYLRVCLSSMARMAGIQQVAMELDSIDGDVRFREITRDGVYDAPLMPRMQRLVAALPRFDILSVDFGDISAPPVGFDPGDYASRYGGEPDTANYLFYPQPSNLQTTAFLKFRSTSS